jgi:hypothetical protein
LTDGNFHKMTGEARFPFRKSSLALALFFAGTLLLGLMFVHAAVRQQADAAHIGHLTAVVENLELTDLCLFTEARYTRHLSQADLYSAFQDHPAALEHFPTGSIAGPPATLRRLNEKLD